MQKKPIVSTSFSYETLEETLFMAPKKRQLFIGIPCENTFQENRVPLTPDAVSVLVNQGHDVVVETKAGLGSFYEDRHYTEAGAQIAYTKEDVFKAMTIIKSAPVSEEEAGMVQMNQVII